jgi:cytochrome c biogenesis protein CcmG, thiol:disulfide interchange protein DsbE
MRSKRIAPFIALAVAVVIAGLFVVLLGSDPPSDESAETNLMDQPAPEARGELADGTAFQLSRRKGDWVILNFFQSSCIPCQQEHPELEKFVAAQQQQPDGARFFTIAWADDRNAVESFFAKQGGGWPVVLDTKGSIAVAFGVSKVPETWIIDPEGNVRFRTIAEVTADFLGSQLERLREGGGS